MKKAITSFLACTLSLTAGDIIREILKTGGRISQETKTKIKNIQLQAQLDAITHVLDPNKYQDPISQTAWRISALRINQNDSITDNLNYLNRAIELIKQGADPNIASNIGQVRLLHMICALGNIEHINLLLYKGANPQLTDSRGWDALHYAQHFCTQDEQDVDTLQQITVLLAASLSTKEALKTVSMKRRTISALQKEIVCSKSVY